MTYDPWSDPETPGLLEIPPVRRGSRPFVNRREDVVGSLSTTLIGTSEKDDQDRVQPGRWTEKDG